MEECGLPLRSRLTSGAFTAERMPFIGPFAASERAALTLSFVIGRVLYDLLKSLDALTTADAPAFAVGFVVSFLTALVVVKGFLAYVSRHSFTAFAWYRIVFGALLLLFAR